MALDNTFGKNIIPDNDDERLDALRRYRIFNTAAESSFDNIAKLATQMFNVPISLISLVDADVVYYKANVGMGNAKTTNRGKSLCSLAVLEPEVTVFEDALKEPCLISNPNVAGDFGLRFYAGAPITTNDGYLIGTLCVIDKKPREFSAHEEALLKGLSKLVMDQIEMRLASIAELDNQFIINEQLSESEKLQSKLNDELAALNEAMAAGNEELTAVNEELTESQYELNNLIKSQAASERKFRSIINQAPVAISILKGRELVVETANEQILQIWGKDKTIIGKPLPIAMPELLGQPYLQMLDDVFTFGAPHFLNAEKTTINYNGDLSDCYFNFVYDPLKNEDGSTHSIMVVAANVTEQVNNKLELKQKHDELTLVAQQLAFTSNFIPQQVWTATPDGMLDYVNEKTIQYFGQPMEALIGEKWLEVVHPADIETAGKAWGNSLATGEPYQTEFRLLSKDGTYVWHLARAIPFYENGTIIKWFGTNTDINSQKLLEQHKNDFIGIASHELRTPITSVKASLQMLVKIKNDPSSELFSKLVERSNRGVQKTIDLLNDLLSVSRINEGQFHLKKHDFDLSKLLAANADNLQLGEARKIELRATLEITVNADENMVEQVIVNFINNAVKYAPQSKDITLLLERNGHMAKLAVKDSGPGIAAEKIPHLFERYYRVDHSGKQAGLGLGLYICAEIIHKHGGEIGVESELGKGSTFWFTLPLINS
jgi:PAS domain S-box-containing protein